MGKYKKYKNSLEKFLSSTEGKRFFNFAYSMGAAIVILGALFKILHLPGGNFMLSLGMGIEVVMFCIQAFDHPSREYNWEQVFPVFETKDPEDRPTFGRGNGGNGGNTVIGNSGGSQTVSSGENTGGGGNGGNGGGGGGTIIIGGLGGGSGEGINLNANMPEGMMGTGNFSGGNFGGVYAPPVSGAEAMRVAGIPSNINISEEDTQSLSGSIQKLSAAAEQLSKMAELTDATQQYLSKLSEMSNQMDMFSQATQSLTEVSNTLLHSYRSITDNSDGISEYSQGYVSQMESLNRNLSGLNTIYEIQLKSISSQIDSIDRINTGLKHIRDMYEQSSGDSQRYCVETEQMTEHIAQLNSVYEKMLTAMTVNMYRPGMVPPQAPVSTEKIEKEDENISDKN